MCVCVRVCACTHVCALCVCIMHTHTHTHVHTHTHKHTHDTLSLAHVRTHICTHVRTHTYMHTQTYICVLSYTCAFVCVTLILDFPEQSPIQDFPHSCSVFRSVAVLQIKTHKTLFPSPLFLGYPKRQSYPFTVNHLCFDFLFCSSVFFVHSCSHLYF